MAEVTLHNELVIHTNGDLPAVGAKLPEFSVSRLISPRFPPQISQVRTWC